jgi:superfamily II DNA/RNA helicase
MRPSPQDFSRLGFKSDLVESMRTYGFTVPAKLLVSVIEALNTDRNIIAVGHERCGKTVSGLIAILHLIDPRLPKLQAIFLTPTKSQAGNTHRKLVELSSSLRIKSLFSCGGTDQREDGQMLKNQGVQVLVATPGRLIQFLKRGDAQTRDIKLFVIDKSEFFTKYEESQADVETLITRMPPTTKFLAFTRELDAKTQSMLRGISRNCLTMASMSDSLNFNSAEHFYLLCNPSEKTDFFVSLLQGPPKQTVVYCNSTDTLDFLEGLAMDLEVEAFKIYERMPGPQLFGYLKSMQRGSYSLVLATDKLKFGIDVTNVELVIDFEVPTSHIIIQMEEQGASMLRPMPRTSEELSQRLQRAFK